MGIIAKFAAIAALSFFYGYVLFLMFHPNVSERYLQFYIEKSVSQYPEAPTKPQGHFIQAQKVIIKRP